MRPAFATVSRNIPISSSAVIPHRAGVGLKPQHFEEILEGKSNPSWLEVHPENYLVDGGPLLHNLQKIRDRYPLSFHSVGMSLGSVTENGNAKISEKTKEVRERHLYKLKALIDRFEPALVSDHLSWSNWNDVSINDLLPVPYTEAALSLMIENVDRAQTILGRSIALENPSSYINFKSRDDNEALGECDFLVKLAEKSGASILLDVNNVYVSAANHGWDASEYIAQIPPELISEIHLAGHAMQTVASGQVLIDDHGSHVCDQVWKLYQETLMRVGGKPTLIEWDTDVPAWSVLKAEADKADELLVRQLQLSKEIKNNNEAYLAQA